MPDFKLIPTHLGNNVRCFIDGGEPVVVLYDMPTGRHASMMHPYLKDSRIREHVYKAKVGLKDGYVTCRAGVRALRSIFDEINPHSEGTRIANDKFLDWMEKTLLPAMDEMDAELRLNVAGILPVPPLTGALRLEINGIKFEAEINDPDKDTIKWTINGFTAPAMSFRQFVGILSQASKAIG